MKTNDDSVDEVFEAVINFVHEHDEETNEVPDLFFTARPAILVSRYELED